MDVSNLPPSGIRRSLPEQDSILCSADEIDKATALAPASPLADGPENVVFGPTPCEIRYRSGTHRRGLTRVIARC